MRASTVRKVVSACSWLVAAVGLILGISHSMSGQTLSSPFFVASIAVFCTSLVVGFAVHRPSSTIAFFAIVTTAAALCGLWLTERSSSRNDQLGSEVLFFAVQVLLAVVLMLVIKSRLGSRTSAVLADGTIVAIGAWLITWVILIRPSIAASTATSLTVARGITLASAIVVVFLLALLVFSDSSPTPASAFFGVSISLLVVTVFLRAIASRGDVSLSATTTQTPIVIALGIASAAFLHSTSRSVTQSGVVRMSPALVTRLTTTTVSLIVPVVVLALTDPDGSQDRIVRTISVTVLALAAMIRIVQSVRANAQTQEHLIRNALTDSLTGLPNRIMMLQHIEHSVQKNWNSHKQTTVLFIDVDRFKNINDSLGHSTGDNVLTDIAKRLLTAIPETATVGRISGDEFVVLDPSTESPTQSVVLAERVLDAFRDPIATSDGDMFITASIGVAYAPRGVLMNADELMRHADTAMYRAKAAGRNCIALFDESMVDQVTKRLDVETALYRALERGEVRLVHQPIIDIDLGIVVGFEALMRWDRGDSGVVAPSDFIPIAEETGTIVPLGSWAINDALCQLRAWIDSGVCSPTATISVNVSPRQLHDPQFYTVVKNALSDADVSPEQLWLEVTESVVITEPVQALASLRRLNSLGVRIAIDDFGTGYSSLSLLQQFPIQCIKIDRSFVQKLESDESTHNIVRTIIAMASAMNADIIAEGIEEPGQLAILSTLNCRKAQGYLISRPLEAIDIPAAINTIHEQEWWKTNTTGR